jgi:hypothetical protein
MRKHSAARTYFAMTVPANDSMTLAIDESTPLEKLLERHARRPKDTRPTNCWSERAKASKSVTLRRDARHWLSPVRSLAQRVCS